MNYGKQYSATPQLLNMMYTNLGRFGTFDDTNREITFLSNFEPTSMSMRDNHFNREASWLKYNGSNMQFCVVKYTRDGSGNLVGTVRTHNITSFPSLVSGSIIGTKKVSDSSYKLYWADYETNGLGIDIILKCWTITLNNPNGEMPWTGSYAESELGRVTTTTDDIGMWRVIGGKMFFTASAYSELIVADMDAETIEISDFHTENPVWQHDYVLGYKIVREQDGDLFKVGYYQRGILEKLYSKLYGNDTNVYGTVTNFRQVTGEHYYYNYHIIFRRYLEDVYNDWWHVQITVIDEEIGDWIEEPVDVADLFDVWTNAHDPEYPSHSLYHYVNKGEYAVVSSAPSLGEPSVHKIYSVEGGLGATVTPPDGYIFYHDPLNCVDDETGNLYMLVINNTEHTMGLVEVGGDGTVGSNNIISTGSTSTYTNELNAVNYGNFIFTWTNDSQGYVDGHLFYFSDDVDGQSQVIMLPEIQ